MKNAWTIEYTRIFLLVLAALIIGLTTKQWIFAILLPCAVYIGWTIFQLRAFERWIRLGAKVSEAPNANGIWQLIVQHIYRAQKKTTQQKKRLTILLNRFESTISALPYATVTLDEHMEIIWANEAAKGTLGINKITDVGQRFDNLVRDPGLQALINDNNNGKPVQLISPVSPAITLMVSCVTFGDDQRLITAKDISQIVSVQKLRKAFIANASHELRTPLTVIAGYLEIMGGDDSLPPPQSAMINNAAEQATRMQSILSDLLTLSKLEEKNQVYPKDSGDRIHIATMLKQLADDIGQTYNSNTIELDVSDTLYIRANEPEMFSLCQNLLTNAVKYSSDNTTVNVQCKLSNKGAASIRFMDCGDGIAPEHLSRLTERFYRVNDQRAHQVDGTGLGLSIVKHILENHGGDLKIHSELGKGSVFSAQIPDYRVYDSAQASI